LGLVCFCAVIGTCTNCGRSGEELVVVHRIYVSYDPVLREYQGYTVLEETERWCLACQAIYPNELADPPQGAPQSLEV
jgi:hypothetical protein